MASSRIAASLRTLLRNISRNISSYPINPYSHQFPRTHLTSQQALFIHLLRRWAAQPTFYYQVALLSGGVAVFYIYNLETVSISGRKRFNIVSPAWEKWIGKQQYEQVLQEFASKGKILSKNSREHVMVERVLRRLLPHCGMNGEGDEEWELHVIDDDTQNAFVMPGGKVFVFRGMLDICQSQAQGQGNADDTLAAVLGHEIAHNVAHHSAERMSQSPFLFLLVLGSAYLLGLDAGVINSIADLAFRLPGSRSQEQEADYIGLLMMAESCYDPRAAVELWGRLEREEKKAGGGAAPPQFLSTHPSSHNRMEKIREWLPQAQEKLNAAGCQNVRGYLGGFEQAADLERFGMISGGGRWG
ncbi:hypothetical protein CERZMDRAFT_110148 [Cercospora zeae-maydis SCOH1-5]|uniref:Peptidase M48 domain-containing protein n=1 Tax=Cercospora zeae-maydis SCOH1-5 TaxID=717836 RepID=A0A6A6FPT5_9PEZI|nr:hypothetical protein CERZMDRAFT_110148 [Cercospora zeae-maydis SCOH1-5]